MYFLILAFKLMKNKNATKWFSIKQALNIFIKHGLNKKCTLRGAISLFVHTAVEEEINPRYSSAHRADLQTHNRPSSTKLEP